MNQRKKLARMVAFACFIAQGQLISELSWSQVILVIVVSVAGNGLYWWSTEEETRQ